MKNMNRYSIVLFAFCMLIACPISGLAVHVSEFVDLSEQIISTNEGVFDDLSFEITNSTGQDWTDFHLTLLSFFGEEWAAKPLFGASPYTGMGNYTLGVSFLNEPTVDIFGLNIPNGETYSFSLNIDYDENNGWQVFGYPTANSQVPEPSIVFLFCSGMMGLVWVRKRMLKQEEQEHVYK